MKDIATCKYCEVKFSLPDEYHARKEFYGNNHMIGGKAEYICSWCKKQANRAYDDHVDPLRAYH